MSEPITLAFMTIIGGIVGSIVTTAFNAAINKKNNFFASLNNATAALNVTTEELVEALLASKQLRQELNKKELEINELKNNYKTLKGITRKLYQLMVEKRIDASLTDKELEMLYDTQPLMLFAEQERRKKNLEA